ncbi:NAD(P)/FAD-dependent oxidoreductase [Amycolatopsis pigmentata]|uniref:NAD(P)/FAD-dependent oxidoreductase n=1 Tax=Amycolatopsis pigmentata TaxID=450801 RepID=A0ABW5FIY6_9PSEU
MSTQHIPVADVVIIGGGIAGVSIGYELAARCRVILLEMESTLAYHTTGRSAATWLATYGNHPIRALTRASREFFLNPPPIFESALTKPLGLVYVGGPGQSDQVRELHDTVRELTPDVRLIDAAEAVAINPMLRPERVELALTEPGALDVDVHELHTGFTRGLRSRGGIVVRAAKAVSADLRDGIWTMATGDGGTYRARTVVNAAGAWSDEVGTLFGAQPIGIVPLRRSIFMVPGETVPAHLPLTIAIDGSYYFKADGDQCLCSPHDETPQLPGDAKPDELEIARAIEAINEATRLNIRHVRSSWAGLRSFAPNHAPVVGPDPGVEGLFWFAGQGGYGIQIAPAAARLGAALILGDHMPADILASGCNPADLDPARLARSVGQARRGSDL